MKIRLVNYEIGIKSGILTKYAEMMERDLTNLGHTVTVDKVGDKKADVNHHINFYSYVHVPGTINTAFVTHFLPDKDERLKILRKVMETCDVGVCMSQETVEWLKKKGIDNQVSIHPAANVERRPRLVAIMTDLYPDGRKRVEMFENLVRQLPNKKEFVFSIIGDGGWRGILEELSKLGLQVQWQPNYNPTLGQAILQTSDYLLYTGNDEGGISVLDAAYAGVRTIAPNIGFHKEIGIDYPFSTQEELNEIFRKIAHNPVADWTWENYAKEHEKLWRSLFKK